MRVWVVLFLLTGCYQPSEVCTGDGCEAPTDGTSDSDAAPTDAPMLCFGAGLIGEQCFQVGGPVVLDASQPLDTGSSSLCATSEMSACFVVGSSIQIDAGVTVDVSGGRPLVLFSASTISIIGVLDVAGHQSATTPKRGPGANTACNAAAGPARMDLTTFIATGGAGGGFGDGGGGGGGGRVSTNVTGSVGGAAGASLAFQGGCDGGVGGFNPLPAAGGGGAVYLMAVQQITVRGLINASGAGGDGGFHDAITRGGGNGGGSGGLIGLEAPSIDVANARLVALGGGGGSGAGVSVKGNPGQDPRMTLPITIGFPGSEKAAGNAGGGGGDTNGGAGLGGGSVLSGAEGGGGGGGGGAGFIRHFGDPTINANGAAIHPPIP